MNYYINRQGSHLLYGIILLLFFSLLTPSISYSEIDDTIVNPTEVIYFSPSSLSISVITEDSFSSQLSDTQRNFVKQLIIEIQQNNLNILAERDRILSLQAQLKQFDFLLQHDEWWLFETAEKYQIKNKTVSPKLFNELLNKVDIIPIDLALSQAAIESAWGKSRFAQQGNNYFGVWCYTRGCGIVPKYRPKGQRQEVKRYNSVYDSVEHYMLTLNRVSAYHNLRLIRSKQRQQGELPSGYQLAAGLSKYSAKGWQYVKIIRNIINKYELDTFNHY